MFGIGWAEFLVIGVVALVVIGPEKLPEAARTLGKVYGYVHRTLIEARESIKAEADLEALKSRRERETKAAEPGEPPLSDPPANGPPGLPPKDGP